MKGIAFPPWSCQGRINVHLPGGCSALRCKRTHPCVFIQCHRCVKNNKKIGVFSFLIFLLFSIIFYNISVFFPFYFLNSFMSSSQVNMKPLVPRCIE